MIVICPDGPFTGPECITMTRRMMWEILRHWVKIYQDLEGLFSGLCHAGLSTCYLWAQQIHQNQPCNPFQPWFHGKITENKHKFIWSEPSFCLEDSPDFCGENWMFLAAFRERIQWSQPLFRGGRRPSWTSKSFLCVDAEASQWLVVWEANERSFGKKQEKILTNEIVLCFFL